MRGSGSILVGVLALVGVLVLAHTVLGFIFGATALALGLLNRIILIAVALAAGAGTLSSIQRGRIQAAAMRGNVAVLAAWGALQGWPVIGTAILALICLAAQVFVARALRASA
ncbi:MAG: hypothetical protein HY320_13655 [Armatimonadetes bacterium]|nr:hypothetical protein [Armatimonadota bacterium]